MKHFEAGQDVEILRGHVRGQRGRVLNVWNDGRIDVAFSVPEDPKELIGEFTADELEAWGQGRYWVEYNPNTEKWAILTLTEAGVLMEVDSYADRKDAEIVRRQMEGSRK